jgi:GDP/UDP-N,N'-diacetylbacillosamine 2-epimerase (hydrolysing)
MKFSKLLLGNTSSGIIEAASFNKRVINIGDRQAGRAINSNVITTEINKDKIIKAVNKAISLGDYNGENIYFNDSKAASSIIIKALIDNELYI